MRKGSIALLVVLLATAALWAGKADDKALELKAEAVGLDNLGKEALYEANAKTLGWPLALNLTLGAGIGSFVQGDVIGGVAGLVCDAASYGLMAYGVAYGFADIIGAIIQGVVSPDDVAISGAGLWLGIGGGALWLASRICQGILPAVYASSYNKKIHKAVFGDIEVALLPALAEDGLKVGLVVGF